MRFLGWSQARNSSPPSPLQLQVLVEIDAVGLHPQVELALLGKVVAGHQLLGQRAGDVPQLGDKGLFGHGAGLLAALMCVTLKGALALGVDGAVFVTVAAVYFKLDGQLPDRPGLDGLGKPVCSPSSSGRGRQKNCAPPGSPRPG